jgi:hypothetical protein
MEIIMKISVDVDLTPEEFRRTLGLPDVSEIQKEMVEQFRQQMLNGADGYDALSLMQPYLNSGLNSMEAMHKAFFGMMTNNTNDKNDK